PQTRLPLRALSQTDGWCDAPEDRGYNRLVRRPYPASHEALWREDGRYDILVVLGHNDAPPISALGSAIFLHVAAEDFRPTEGCIALALPDLRDVLHHARPGDALQIARDGSGRPRPE
ncbi:MAG: L,D-transpeptidase, partial [Maricaulaceae bacterium]